VLICSYLMKHYRFTAEEVIGYIRVCRPGSVIGPQQGFIKDIQRIMWLEGDAYRAKHGPNPPPLMWGITPAAASTSLSLVTICHQVGQTLPTNDYSLRGGCITSICTNTDTQRFGHVGCRA